MKINRADVRDHFFAAFGRLTESVLFLVGPLVLLFGLNAFEPAPAFTDTPPLVLIAFGCVFSSFFASLLGDFIFDAGSFVEYLPQWLAGRREKRSEA